jgi:hypothetical protein
VRGRVSHSLNFAGIGYAQLIWAVKLFKMRPLITPHPIEPSHAELLTLLRTEASEHSYRSLFEHLQGTYSLLKLWGSDEPTSIAGLFHSIYGTQAYKVRSADLESRPRVRQIIGEKAEWLAYLFCVCDRRSFAAELGKSRPQVWSVLEAKLIPVEPMVVQSLVEVMVANAYEQIDPELSFPRSAWLVLTEALARAENILSPVAFRSLSEVLVNIELRDA